MSIDNFWYYQMAELGFKRLAPVESLQELGIFFTIQDFPQ